MARPNLAVDWRDFDGEIKALAALMPSLQSLPIGHRKLVAEIVLIRLFLLLENTTRSVCCKLLCGANYMDGLTPLRNVNARSATHANTLMCTHGRAKPKRFAEWTQTSDIRDNLAFTMQGADPFFAHMLNYGTLWTDLRFARNHIAHRNEGTRQNFHKLLVKHYGGVKRGVSPGVLLLKPQPGGTVLLNTYLVSCRIFMKGLVRG